VAAAPEVAGPRSARLVARRPSEGGEARLDGRALVVVGRSPSSDLQLRDRAVSRRHCEIAPEAGEYVLRDLGSNNGTFLNGRPVRSASLRDGDVIRVGLTELEFSFADDGGACRTHARSR
jgi:pSer/pThr/pTyr-binding forkhead associated (FHA) protein